MCHAPDERILRSPELRRRSHPSRRVGRGSGARRVHAVLGFPVVLTLVHLLNGGVYKLPAEHGFTGLKVRLHTADVEGTIRFYEDVLGLQVVDRWSDGGDAGVVFGLQGTAGTAFIEFGQISSPSNGTASVQLRTGDMVGFLARVGGRWTVDGPHERPWGSVYTYLTDPNGVRVIVYGDAV